MKDPIQKYFNVGTIQWMTHPARYYSLLESVKIICCDEYFGAYEITHIEDPEERDKVKSMLEQSHMKVCYGAQPRLLGPKLNPNDVDEEGRKKAEAVLIDSVDEAEYMGAKGIAFLAGKWTEETKELQYQQLLKTTRAVCDYAATKGMMVEIEVFDYDVDKAALIGPAPLAARFAADMRTTNSNFGLLIDLSHIPITHENIADVVRTTRPYITHFHLGNAVAKKGAKGYGDLHQRFGYPESANDTPELLEYFQVLKEEGFFNKENPYVLSLEVTPTVEEDADIILANTKRVINRAWALLED
ncbi:MAG: sugar phosphate isomerase/epimerase [Lachnospiraceae bacterium]|nr:sugar phosphate isomerase/epimerase [Lachnospiraceae bacterium]